ncbi:MAG: hypothetical protein VW809_16485 [Deltaproteobacteria bacterium]
MKLSTNYYAALHQAESNHKSRGILELKGEVHVELLECLGLRSG